MEEVNTTAAGHYSWKIEREFRGIRDVPDVQRGTLGVMMVLMMLEAEGKAQGNLTAAETELELCFVLVIEELLDLGAGSGVLDGGKKLVTVGGSCRLKNG